MSLSYGEQLIRLLVALVMGGLVGLERNLAGKPAGIRTHMLVSVTCTMLTMVSAYGFAHLDAVNRDPARLIANILTGIAFLSAGVIYVVSSKEKDEASIIGLTTGAGIWGVAGLGIPIGLGHYFLASITFVIMGVALAMEKVERLIHEKRVRHQKRTRP